MLIATATLLATPSDAILLTRSLSTVKAQWQFGATRLASCCLQLTMGSRILHYSLMVRGPISEQTMGPGHGVSDLNYGLMPPESHAVVVEWLSVAGSHIQRLHTCRREGTLVWDIVMEQHPGDCDYVVVRVEDLRPAIPTSMLPTLQFRLRHAVEIVLQRAWPMLARKLPAPRSPICPGDSDQSSGDEKSDGHNDVGTTPTLQAGATVGPSNTSIFD